MTIPLRIEDAGTLTFGSLFAGIGGFDLGFERAGMSCKWQVEIDDYANRVLEKHWPNVHRERDICECGAHNLGRVDVICGGFPCQDISYAGRGAGLDGERSVLFFEAIRVVRELRPRIVVLENVAALLTRGLDRVLGTLAEIGYDAEWHCIPAASVGAPHIRDRVFVLAHAKHNGFSTSEGKHTRDQQQQGWSQKPDSDEQLERSGDGPAISANDTDAANTQWWSDGSNTESTGSEQGKQLRGTISGNVPRSNWWTTEPNVGRVANGVPARVDRLRGLGNAVVPQIAEWIGRRLMEKLK